MGQYFKLVNLDKKEYIASTDKISVSAKFWEWGANAEGVLPLFLMRQSNQSGGGDIISSQKEFDDLKKRYEGDAKGSDAKTKKFAKKMISSMEKTVFINAGRWAGDRVMLVGDYDKSGLYEKVQGNDWKNILPEIHNEFQRFYWGYIKEKPSVLKDALIPSLEPSKSKKSAVVKAHTRKTKKGQTRVRGHIRG